jgi:hypothetical protein
MLTKQEKISDEIQALSDLIEQYRKQKNGHLSVTTERARELLQWKMNESMKSINETLESICLSIAVLSKSKRKEYTMLVLNMLFLSGLNQILTSHLGLITES